MPSRASTPLATSPTGRTRTAGSRARTSGSTGGSQRAVTPGGKVAGMYMKRRVAEVQAAQILDVDAERAVEEMDDPNDWMHVGSRPVSARSSNGGSSAITGKDMPEAAIPQNEEKKTNQEEDVRVKAASGEVGNLALERDWLLLRTKVAAWELAFVMDTASEIWNDAEIPARIVRQWEWVTKSITAEAAKKVDREHPADMVSSLATLVGSGMGGEANEKKADSFERRGHELFEMENYKEALQNFKDASNWFFKSGNKKKSDNAKDWAKKARTREIEEEVDKKTAVSLECHCVCEWVRVYDFLQEAMIRTAKARAKWIPQRPSELALSPGDVLTVLEKDVEETNANADIIWYRGVIQVPEDSEGVNSRPGTGDVMEQGGKPSSAAPAQGSRPGSRPGTAQGTAQTVGKTGLFPTRQLLYDERMRPMLDDDGNRMSNFVVILNPSPIFVKYAVGNASEVDREEGEEEDMPTAFGESTRTMDSGEFVAMLRDQRIVPPQGHLPGIAQVSFDVAINAFREANRGEGGDDDIAQCDFEEFIVAMRLIRQALAMSEDKEDIERSPPGAWACSYAERLLGGALADLNKAYVLMAKTDKEWADKLKHRCKIKAIQLGAFQEAHARLLTRNIKYDVAYDKYTHARQLYGGDTGQAETSFASDHEALGELERAFVVNQYKAAMQLLKLTAPNPSSHLGIPPHVGDPNKKQVQVAKAYSIFEEMGDHQAMGMTMRAGASLALRQGDVKGSLDAAEASLNEYARVGDSQGLAAAYRILADAQMVSGMVVQAMGSIKAAVQISADSSDFVNECTAYVDLGDAQLWIGDLHLAEQHFHKCLSLCQVSKDVQVEGRAICGRGYVSVLEGRLDDGLELLESGALVLQGCDDRSAVAHATFEAARIRRLRGEGGWQKIMENAATTLKRSVPVVSSQGDKLAVARADATAWLWRVNARLASELYTRMTQGETLIDTMGQLSWEALQEGKSVLAAIEKVGDEVLRARVIEQIASMQMLGLRDGDKVDETLNDAVKVYERNSCRTGLSRLSRMRASVSIFKKDYRQAGKYLRESFRVLQQSNMVGSEEEGDTMWLWSIANRLSGEGGGGGHEMRRATEVYAALGAGRLCSLCSGHCRGACYTCLLCYQRDYCVDCYSECAFTGRSCHPTSSMLRSNTADRDKE